MKRKQLLQYIEAGEDVYTHRVAKEIERNRKGDFELILLDAEGKRLSHAKAELHMTDLDFRFGANIFMLGEYDSEEKNRLYEEKYTALFNAASIPLYWEGTEPKQGCLRYAKGTPRDIYRRPPVEEVMDFCEAHHLHMKGHPLFWHEFVPDWLPNTYGELKPLIVERFQQIAQTCGKRVESFDVVNEPSRIYDVHLRDRRSGRTHIVPEDDYCVELFRLARELFPAAKLILNDVTGAVFSEFRGKYSGYYLLLKDLLSRGVPIDEIGFQCHIAGGPEQAYNTEILCDILDTYATLGKPINISEISIASEFEGETDEELQALAAERLYQTCFSHPAVTGITWWNLPDDGVLTTKRVAAGENLPSTGLLDGNYREKPAYQRLQQLITREWRTDCHVDAPDGVAKFRGFYGTYCLTVTHGAHRYEVPITLTRDASRVQTVRIPIQ